MEELAFRPASKSLKLIRGFSPGLANAGLIRPSLSAPLNLLNALTAENDSQVHQLLQDISAYLGLQLQGAAGYVHHVANVKQLASTMAKAEMPPSAVAAKTPSQTSISLSAEGTPPSQIIKVLANRSIGVCRVEYMLTDETCIVAEDVSLEGQTIGVPLSHDALTKLWNTPRPDMNHYDNSGPAKLALIVADNGNFRQLILPIRMEDMTLGNTMYRKAIGSKTFYVR